MSTIPVVGLPGVSPGVAGIGFEASANRLLVSFADDGSNNEDRVAEVALDGTVAESAPDFADDMDGLGYRSTTLQLLGWDPNAPTAMRVFSITGLFGFPVTALVATPPSRGDVGDIALDASGVIYADRFDGGGGFLLRLDTAVRNLWSKPPINQFLRRQLSLFGVPK